MDQIRLLVKDVLHKIQDIPDIPFSSVKMSEITSRGSLSTPTSTSDSLDSVSTPTSQSDADHKTVPKSEYGQQVTENQSPKVELRKSASISTHLESVYISNKQSMVSVIRDANSAPVLFKEDKPLPARIIMGKRDLMRTRSTDSNNEEALVVHELVHDKYRDKVQHYIGRMYQRRVSRESRSTDDDGTSSNYSAGSFKAPDDSGDGNIFFPPFYTPEGDDLNFLQSTDELNKATTIESSELRSSTLSRMEGNEKEFDSKIFLQEALGDMFSDSQYTVSTIKSSKLQHSVSVDPVSTGGSLISKAGTVYNSMRRSFRRACSFRETSTEENVTIRSQNRVRCQSYSPQHFNSVENLTRDLYVQNGIIFQVSKALTLCRKTKDVTSTEYIEAEKILLVTSCQKEATQAALDLLQFGDKPNQNHLYSGTLQISDLVFHLRKDNSTEEEPTKKFEEYFVIVLTSGKTVLASKVLLADNTGAIQTGKSFEFTGLQTDFEVNVSIYSLQVKCTVSTDGKHSKKERSLLSPYAKILFHMNSHKSSRRNLQIDNVSSIKPSSFTLWGSCVICCSDIQKTHFRLHHASLQSSLAGQFTAALTADVKLSNRMGGFLTIGFEDKAPLVWNRRWCVLKGPLLKYWNYPSEEFNSEPVGVIDLTRASSKVSTADRSICPRPKSLLLQVRSREGSVLTYFLTADTLGDKERWKTDINFVIETLERWNCLRYNELVSSL